MSERKSEKAQGCRAGLLCGSVRQRQCLTVSSHFPQATLPGAWVLKGSGALARPLLSVDAAEVVVIPLQRGLTSEMASALQTLLSDVSSSVSVPHRRHQGLAALARRQGSHGCFVCLSLVALILTTSSQLLPGRCPVSLTQQPTFVQGGSCVLFCSCPLGERTGPTRAYISTGCIELKWQLFRQ